MRGQVDAEQYGEFKGNTSAKLEIIFGEIKALRAEVQSLSNWKNWTMGASAIIGAVGGFLFSLLREFINLKS